MKAKIKTIWTAKELIAMPSGESKFLLHNYLPSEGMGALVGMPGIGKSQFARQLAILVAAGATEFLGMRLNTIHRRVIYVTTEDYPDQIKFMLQKQLEGLGLDASENLIFISAGMSSPEELMKKIVDLATKYPVDLIVIDSYGDVFNGRDINSNSEIRSSLKLFDEIAQQNHCFILFLHHINKKGYSAKPGQEHVQGGSAFTQKLRTVFYLTDGKGDIRELNLVKGNYTSKKARENPLILEFSEENFLFKITDLAFESEPESEFRVVSREEKDITKILASKIFRDETLSAEEFLKRHREITFQSDRTAYRNRQTMAKLGLITEAPGGYRLNSEPMPEPK
ncbi:MAG: AAA family ATPase [Cytophagales bacterium]|nr:AAA family ATPase [Cytophagales bacterium]